MTHDILADDLRRQSEAARGLVVALAGEKDALVADMVEGETSFLEAIAAAINEMDNCEIIAAGCAAKVAEISARKAREEARVERLRGLIEQAMLVAAMPSIKLPTATLSVKNMPPKPVVIAEADVPATYWRQPDPVIDKKAINAAIAEGHVIPGVSMSNGSTSLQIRRS